MSVYLVIDLKSFYASVECVERGLDPMTTNLVVADPDRSDKTICLAVSPSMKALGVRNRCRVFEIPPGIDYIMAEPQMQKYIDYAANIYAIYLRYIAPEDIHVYSVDEAFLDLTHYLDRYHMTAREMALFLMDKITEEIGVRSTAGIGTNLYLAKIALDVTAKHSPDFIGELTEESYRETLWDYRPLTKFWRIGAGIAERLAGCGIFTMRDIAMADEELLYRLFGIDAELLIDHAWGRESVTIADIKAYKPKSTSITQGQVLMRDYSYTEGLLIVKEMTDALCLQLADKKLKAGCCGLLVRPAKGSGPAPNVSVTFERPVSSPAVLIPALAELYERCVPKSMMIRGFNLSLGLLELENGDEQLSLLGEENEKEKRSRELQESLLTLKKKFGKNAVLRGMDFEDAATTRERNEQIGGHKAGRSAKEGGR